MNEFLMSIGLNILLSVIGFVVLIKSADFFVDGAASLARNFKVSTGVIGLTVVAFGTSAPELAISFNSLMTSNTDMLFGNVIGSNIVNILVIFGIAIIIKPFKVQKHVIKKEMPILLLVTLGVSFLFLDSLFDSGSINTISRTDSLVLFLFFAVFIYYLVTVLTEERDENINGEAPKYKVFKSIVVTVFALAGIILGSDFVVDNVSSFAAGIGVSQKIIAVTVISIGTSLPELVTTVVAAKKGENNMAVGNIIGSNIFNICVVLGLPIALLGDASTTAFGIIDVIFLLSAVVIFWIFSATGREFSRYEGVFFVSVYVVYAVYIFLQ